MHGKNRLARWICFTFVLTTIVFPIGCFSSPKRNAISSTPATPLDTYKPLPDPRKAPDPTATPPQANANAATTPNANKNLPPLPKPLNTPADTTPGLTSPAVPTASSPAPATSSPAPILPTLQDPAPTTPQVPKLGPQSNNDSLETKPIARASSVDLPRATEPAVNDIGTLLTHASHRLKSIDTLESKMIMRDIKEGVPQPTEVVRFRHKQSPYSVHMTWIGEQFQGRDILYVSNKYEGKIQMLTAKGDIPLLGPQQVSMPPDDPTLKSRSKHDIRDAGPGYVVRHLLSLWNQQTFASRLHDKGMTERNDHKGPLRLIEEHVPPGDKELPKGGKRQYYFDVDEGSPSLNLPVVIIIVENGGRNAESMLFSNFRCNHLNDADFDIRSLGKR